MHYCYMPNKNKKTTQNTNDQQIRTLLIKELLKLHKIDPIFRIIEELGINHGSTRVDIAVVNGVMHGYEIKSDRDTLDRLPQQAESYNAVFDKMTLVVGLSHLYEAIYIVPDWWGIILARESSDGKLYFSTIREPEQNTAQDSVCMARLLWTDEALKILENFDCAKGFKTKTRAVIYQRLADQIDQKTLNDRIREQLFSRTFWRHDQKLMTSGGLVPL